MYYPDLSNECQLRSGPHIRAVGWLGKDHPYTTGHVPLSFLDKLRQYIAEAWQPVIAFGLHECELCVEKPFVCGSNLWIATESVVYIAPGMVLHYIEEHGYKPPEEYVEAVLESHPQGSTEFVKLVEKFLDGV